MDFGYHENAIVITKLGEMEGLTSELCLDGSGCEKLRLLDDFTNFLQQQIILKVTQGDSVMKQMPTHLSQAIGNRMLYRLQNLVSWGDFISNRENPVNPDQVLTKLSAITEINSSKISVILCDDTWVIVICAATIYQPVNGILADSQLWTLVLQTTSSERPKINGRDVFDVFDHGNRALTQLFIDYMDEHGRALKETGRFEAMATLGAVHCIKIASFAQNEFFLCYGRIFIMGHDLALDAIWMLNKTKGFSKGSCSCGNGREKCFLYQPAAGTSSGDASLCLEDATKGFFYEVHHFQCVEENISLDIFAQ
ncbi:hypothetical protein Plhal304r1_c030g0098541 [Plasmopara halstedii]